MSKGSETRGRIIAKAAVLFNRKGFAGCSMQDIVEAVGLEKGSLYGHFSTKEELAVASFEHAWEQTSAARLANMDEAENAIEKLKIHVHNLVSIPPFQGGCPLLNTIVDSDDGSPALKKSAREALKGWRSFLESVVKEGQERKEIRPDVDPEEVAVLVISQLEGALAFDRADRKAGFAEKAGRFMTAYLECLAVPQA